MRGSNKRLSRRSRTLVVLLLFVLLVSPACASSSGMASTEQREGATTAPKDQDAAGADEPRTEKDVTASSGKDKGDGASGERFEAVLPEDVLSDKELEETKPPKYDDWYRKSEARPDKLTSGDSSVGTIPSVKPFNFGRDPGGPEDKTLYLTVPKLGLQKIPVFNEVSEEKFKESVVHVPVTGFSWQEGANTYIAGHRTGYPGMGFSYVFFHLDWLTEGDRIILRDTAGKKYLYRVTEKVAVTPDNVEVMEPKDGKSLVSLQTCTLPDYKKRLIIHGELVRKST